jgi:hypothetical protein
MDTRLTVARRAFRDHVSSTRLGAPSESGEGHVSLTVPGRGAGSQGRVQGERRGQAADSAFLAVAAGARLSVEVELESGPDPEVPEESDAFAGSADFSLGRLSVR